MTSVTQDVRHSLRTLWKNKGFTAVAVLTLALGIGVNTAMFSVLNTFLFRSLPYPESDRLVEMAGGYQGQSGEMAVTYQEFRFLHEQSPVFQYLAATTPVGCPVGQLAGNPGSSGHLSQVHRHSHAGRL